MSRGAGFRLLGGARGERGANLVEFAIVMPFLLLLLLGIIEFAWLFGLSNDVRHGAREGARYAAVDAGDNDAIRVYVCEAMEPLGGPGFDELRIAIQRVETNGIGGFQIGDSGRITVEADVTSLTGLGFIEALMPEELSSTIEFRIEQGPSWSDLGLTDTTC